MAAVSSPGAPSGGVTGDMLAAAAFTHYGHFGVAAVYRTITIDWVGVLDYLNACITAKPRVGYGLGAKIPNRDAVPGKDFKAVDCSGFVRILLLRYASPHIAFPDGSVIQHQWVRTQGYQPCSVADSIDRDGKVRIAFLSPSDTHEHIGHVVLIKDSVTVESHGHVGPDSRAWNGAGWQAATHVYVLDG